jgi:hypothetical protein
VQTAGEPAPLISLYVPEGHLTQLALLFAPGSSPKEPGGHMVHTAAFLEME